MSTASIRELIQATKGRYNRSSKAEKRVILDELEASTRQHRKQLIRRLNRSETFRPKKKPPGRPPTLTPSDLVILKRVIPIMGWPCGVRLKAMLPLWLPHDEAALGSYQAGQLDRLYRFSGRTLDRHLRPVRKQAGIKSRSRTKPGSLLKSQIPLRTGPWDETEPGFMEADTVAHCGHRMVGEFAWSLVKTDIATGYIEIRAVWNKLSTHVRDQLEIMDQAIPFTIKGLDVDNGSEFINYVVAKYMADHPDVPVFTRSRPYEKNDNAHVEQNQTILDGLAV